MSKNLLQESKNIHFIGIGGIGVSAVARMMLAEGKNVSGSDISKSEITDELEKLGAKFKLGQSADMIPKDTDLIIYSPAVTVYDPNLLGEIKKKGIQALSYPESLHEISKDKFTIAVSGTHGKTTTTAMIAKVMIDAGLEPTVIVGSLLKEHKSNFIAGKGEYFVVEACEYRNSFLNILPTIALVTNIDNDHLDFFKDIADIQKSFTKFVKEVPADGYIICNPKDKKVEPILHNVEAKVVDSTGFKDSKLKLKVPGVHNIRNAEMALAVAHILGIDKHKALKSLENFEGTWRRFEYKGETAEGVIIYDDYGHHPTEIKATLSGAREFFGNKKITVVFQPHLYSRTKLLLNDFSHAFKDADTVVLAPIYAAREAPDLAISSDILADKIGDKATSLKNFAYIEKYLKFNLKTGDVLITMGAGDVYKTGESLLRIS